ncbi:hypothetical protein MSP8887_01668 [Marinomonas spartinae]|uniref:hypothetical protein n=1 Tax=Marinomonas spartinae TaxID=1792290 RepID=UPI000808E58E|nr:hypothetical protein [Marinomonas spartinae]SBS32199.1 hypothetical protein MSP8887_01668 [Marinomonas spartinae]
MSDRDYTGLFPSWGRFLVFNLIFYIGIFSIAMSAVSFADYVALESVGYIFIVPQFFVFLLFLLRFVLF